MPEAAGQAALLRLMAWLSPAFPTGAFSYSHGLERAVQDGLVGGAPDLREWIEGLLRMGSGWNDAVLLAEAWRCARAGDDLAEVAELAEALAGSRERHMESMMQGEAFLKAAASWPAPVAGIARPCAYSVAVGSTAGVHHVPLADVLGAFLQAFATNLVQAGIRLGVLGQREAVDIVAGLESLLMDIAAQAAAASLEDLGGCAFMSDIAAMRHETQYSRLFRS